MLKSRSDLSLFQNTTFVISQNSCKCSSTVVNWFNVQFYLINLKGVYVIKKYMITTRITVQNFTSDIL